MTSSVVFLVPEASTPRAVLASEALVAPVPPFAIGKESSYF